MVIEQYIGRLDVSVHHAEPMGVKIDAIIFATLSPDYTFPGSGVLLGDKLGLYRALGANGGLTSHQLAETTGTAERYVREWLAAQAATGYVDYSAEEGTFSLSPEQRQRLVEIQEPPREERVVLEEGPDPGLASAPGAEQLAIGAAQLREDDATDFTKRMSQLAIPSARSDSRRAIFRTAPWYIRTT